MRAIGACRSTRDANWIHVCRPGTVLSRSKQPICFPAWTPAQLRRQGPGVRGGCSLTAVANRGVNNGVMRHIRELRSKVVTASTRVGGWGEALPGGSRWGVQRPCGPGQAHRSRVPRLHTIRMCVFFSGDCGNLRRRWDVGRTVGQPRVPWRLKPSPRRGGKDRPHGTCRAPDATGRQPSAHAACQNRSR